MAKAGGSIRVTVQGAQETIAKLAKLRTTEANKMIRKGLRAGSKIIQRETIAQSPVGPARKDHKPGTLKRSFKVRAMKRKRGRIGILVQSGKGFFKGDTFYSGFVALGHKAGPRRLGNDRKQVKANEFMKRAADKSAPEAIRVLEETVKRELETMATSVKIKT
jgi:HK97 gp10 family phage protein